MAQPDFERARQYALDRLENELPPALTYHGLGHTRDDVLPAAERLAALEGLPAEERLLLRTAVYYHDTGFIEQYRANEPIAVRIANAVLPGFGYSLAQVAVITGLILATRIPQEPHTRLEQVMSDADLDSLGREDYWTLSEILRAEQALFAGPVSDEEWLASQLSFLQAHHYFTPSAKMLREAGKQRHMAELIAQLQKSKDHSALPQ